MSGDGNGQFAEAMMQAARRIHSGERAYDVCIEACAQMLDVVTKADHGGAAYNLWAEISDLLDAPSGPQSEAACSTMAEAVAMDWLAIDAESVEAVAAYFERWDPGIGAAWLAVAAREP